MVFFQESFFRLAIATYDLVEFYLFFCNFDWQADNDTVHGSVAEAMEIADRKFGVKASQWNFTSRNLSLSSSQELRCDYAKGIRKALLFVVVVFASKFFL